MDFWGAVRLLRRRWYAAVAALAVSAGVALATFVSIPTIYESSAVAVLTSPANGARFSPSVRPEDVERINPLLAFDGSLETTAQILRQVLRDPATKKDLGAGADTEHGADYEVTNADATTSGPFVFVDVTSDSPEASQEMAAAVMQRTSKELEDRQRAVGAPPQTFIAAELLVQPTAPEAKINGKLRYMGAALVLALIVTFAGVFAFDNVVTTRRRRGAVGGVELPDRYPAMEQRPAFSPQPGAQVPVGVVARHPEETAGGDHVPDRSGRPTTPVGTPAPPAATPNGSGGSSPVNGQTPGVRRRRPSPRLTDPPPN